MDKIKVLVMSVSPWDNDNSVGNSLTGIFGGMEDRIEFSNIYCKSGKPNNDICRSYFRINEKTLVKSLLGFGKSGSEVDTDCGGGELNKTERKAFDFARKKRWKALFLLREIVWCVCRWKTAELDGFLEKVNPDLVFLLLNNSVYSNKLAMYVKHKLNVPMIAYVWDDIYGVESRNRGFYARAKRKMMRRTVSECDFMYTITRRQSEEYADIFKKPCRVLTKGAEFGGLKPTLPPTGDGVRLSYVGNIGDGRWQTLIGVCSAVDRLNREGEKVEFDIYTATPIDTATKRSIGGFSGVRFRGSIPNGEVRHVHENSDVLLHIEPFDEVGKRAVRLSFSTKLVDYMRRRRCIFAVGPSEVASMEYLAENDAAVCVTDVGEVYGRLRECVTDSEKRRLYADKAWECGRRNHEIATIHQELITMFENVTKMEVYEGANV